MSPWEFGWCNIYLEAGTRGHGQYEKRTRRSTLRPIPILCCGRERPRLRSEGSFEPSPGEKGIGGKASRRNIVWYVVKTCRDRARLEHICRA